jgi:hypothetical protein
MQKKATEKFEILFSGTENDGGKVVANKKH